jgi:hypothetical protein
VEVDHRDAAAAGAAAVEDLAEEAETSASATPVVVTRERRTGRMTAPSDIRALE